MRKRRKRTQGNWNRRRRNPNALTKFSYVKIGILSLLLIVFVTKGTAEFSQNLTEINIVVQDAEMEIGKEKPVFQAVVTSEGDLSVVLDEETEYTIQNLVEELEKGTGYTMTCQGDGSETGTFEITPELTSALSTPLNTEWLDKVKINLTAGTLTVK